MTQPIVIIGTGLAGYNLAKEIRKLDQITPLVMITADDGSYYSKPMLSTGFAKNKSAEELVIASVGDMAEQLKAEIRTHTLVTSIDVKQNQIWIGQEAVHYRDLILAWGAEVIKVPVAGDSTDLIFSINDLEDYSRFRQALAGKKNVLIMGAGLIGCEFANDMKQANINVTVVAPCEQLMPSLLPNIAAQALQNGLEAAGVVFKLGLVVKALNREGEQLKAQLSDGTFMHCDLVLSAVGLRPRIAIAQTAGMPCDHGVVVNGYLQSANDHIYALGDCAQVEGVNLQYVLPLMTCARALAQTLSGQAQKVNYGAMPVVIKTPACPVVVSPPAKGINGTWVYEGVSPHIKATFKNAAGELMGFALTGDAVQEKNTLTKSLVLLKPE